MPIPRYPAGAAFRSGPPRACLAALPAPAALSAMAALLAGLALAAGAARADMLPGQRGDGLADLYVAGRDLILQADGGGAINGFILTSAAGLLAGEPYAFAQGLFVTDTDRMLADQFGFAQAGVHDLGRVLTFDAGLPVLEQDLTLTYTVAGQAGVRHATILPACPGDCDLDGVVGDLDLTRLDATFGRQGGAVWVDGDFNGDGLVNWLDYLTLKRNYGPAGPAASALSGRNAAAAAPEPASSALLAALAAWACVGRPGRRLLPRPTSRTSRRTA